MEHRARTTAEGGPTEMISVPPRIRPLEPGECSVLADALGDGPETVIPVHQLRRGLARAYAVGHPPGLADVIVQGDPPKEPWAFGADADTLWDILQTVHGWTCVTVGREIAAPLGVIIERETGAKVRHYGDVYHALTRPAARFVDDAVRPLTEADLPYPGPNRERCLSNP